MEYIHRKLETNIRLALERGKSVLLLGPRQTGKTTLVKSQLHPDLSYSFAKPEIRLRYEKDPGLLGKEIQAFHQEHAMPLVFLDEVQRLPFVMDVVQDLIDEHVAQFILTGSSARKLKHGAQVNLLPGRVVSLTMDSLALNELPKEKLNLDDLLVYGSLPEIFLQKQLSAKEVDLSSYVTTYLEEEIRIEANIRKLGAFTRFLEIAASESGNVVNFTRLSQDVGVSDKTIASYYELLEDSLIAVRIDPILKSRTRRKLIHSSKYLFFDLGLRRTCANEGTKLSIRMQSHLFEQFIGLELLRYIHQLSHSIKLKFWRDLSGPEIDFVLDIEQQYTPIEVKWSEVPSEKDIKHLRRFMTEYSNVSCAYVICRTPHRFQLDSNIIAIPWQEIPKLMENAVTR